MEDQLFALVSGPDSTIIHLHTSTTGYYYDILPDINIPAQVTEKIGRV